MPVLAENLVIFAQKLAVLKSLLARLQHRWLLTFPQTLLYPSQPLIDVSFEHIGPGHCFENDRPAGNHCTPSVLHLLPKPLVAGLTVPIVSLKQLSFLLYVAEYVVYYLL